VREPYKSQGVEEERTKSLDPEKPPVPQLPDVEIVHEDIPQFVVSVFEKNASQVVNPDEGVIY
jgi:hypothetical protein